MTATAVQTARVESVSVRVQSVTSGTVGAAQTAGVTPASVVASATSQRRAAYAARPAEGTPVSAAASANRRQASVRVVKPASFQPVSAAGTASDQTVGTVVRRA